MIPAKLLALATLIASATSFTLPAVVEDGFYRVHIDDNGHEIHERVNATTAPYKLSAEELTPPKQPIEVTKRRIEARDAGWGFGNGILTSWCGCGFTLDHGDCDAAVQDLKNQVGGGVYIDFGYSYYSIRGSVGAFACNTDLAELEAYGALHSLVDATLLTDSYSFITSECGWYIAGTSYYIDYAPPSDWVESLIGYMRSAPGTDFCANSNTSPASSCPQ